MVVIDLLRTIRSYIKLRGSLLQDYIYDLNSFYRVSNIRHLRKTKDQKLGSLIANYHIIEKGLCMPNRRLGFGLPVLEILAQECIDYYNQFGNDNSQFSHAVQVLYEYEAVHKDNNFELPFTLVRRIDILKSLLPLSPSHQLILSKEDFFRNSNSSFDLFSSSRHSTRHFDGPANKEDLIRAIELAQNAPSSCNKQPTCVHLVMNYDIVQRILQEQRGNRGFGHNICSIIVITTNMSCYSQMGERKSGFVDAGIYSMNLLYSLHYYKIGAIPLIWLSDKKRDRWLNESLGISKDEMPVLIIGVGSVSEKTALVNSPRKEIKDVLTIHE